MTWARNLAGIVVAAMLLLAGNILVHGSLDQGLGMDRFLAGLADPWRAFIGFDLMAGLLLMSGWIVWREQGGRAADTAAWILCILWWGNIIVAAYILVALRQSAGDPARFLMGRRGGQLRPAWTPPGAVRVVALVAALGTAAFAASRIAQLGLTTLAGQAYVPGFAPIVLGLCLLAFPARVPAAVR